MIGSAVQNGVALSDSIFLLYYSETDFAAIGIVSIFYLIISSIGYGFSKGGQILIARRVGQSNKQGISSAFWSMQVFQLGIATLLFLFLYFISPYFLGLFIKNEIILSKCIEYLDWRSWSIFFSYLGLGYIALYTGISRTSFIVIDVVIMMLVNLLLNFLLIFGYWGLPEMGIAGAGLGSAIAEVTAFIIFWIYASTDKKGDAWQLKYFDLEGLLQKIKAVASVGLPVVVQSIVGLGSWFVFFAFIEKLGERALSITNFSRIIYLALSVPTWGFSSGINTIVSFIIGTGDKSQVIQITRKTAFLAWGVTYLLALPILLFPQFSLQFLFNEDSMSLLVEATPILRMILVTLIFFSIGGVYYNGLVGTGDTWFGLWIQIICVLLYIIYLYLIIHVFQLPLLYAWTGELFFWVLSLSATIFYLRGGRWKRLEI
jgi:MATE family multidrug resistance protein